MTHPTSDALEAHVDGSLAPEQRLAMDAHLRSCAGCAMAVTQVRQLVSVLESLDDDLTGLPDTFAEHLVEEVAPPAPVDVAPVRASLLLQAGICCTGLAATCVMILAVDRPVAGATDDVIGGVDVLLGSPFQVQAGILAALAVTALAGLSLIGRVVVRSRAPQGVHTIPVKARR